MLFPNQPPKYAVGEIIYEPRNPQRYGKVLSSFHAEEKRFSGRPFYTVRWKDGTEETRWELDLKSLEVLLADHERKCNTHRKNIEKAQKL